MPGRAFLDRAHDRVVADAFFQGGDHHGDAAAVTARGGLHHPLALGVAQTADIEVGMQGMDQDLGALAQHFSGGRHMVGHGEQVVGDTQQGLRLALHGGDGGEQLEQRAPAAQGHGPHIGLVAALQGAVGGPDKGDDGRTHFGRRVSDDLGDGFARGAQGVV